MHGLGGLDQGNPGSGLTVQPTWGWGWGRGPSVQKGSAHPQRFFIGSSPSQKPFALYFFPLIDGKFLNSAQPAALGSVGVGKAPMFFVLIRSRS